LGGLPGRIGVSNISHRPTIAAGLKKFLPLALKYGISFAILGYLFYKTAQNDTFHTLWEQPKNWWLLAAAFLLSFASVAITFYRWYLLVAALGVPFTIKDAFRLGFLGYLLNFFTLGVIGGDVLKTVAVAKQQPSRSTEIFASVALDRLIGLYALFATAAVAYLAIDIKSETAGDGATFAAAIKICQISLVVTIVGAVGSALALLPGFTTLKLWDSLGRVPKVGGLISRLVDAARIYRRKVHVLLAASGLSFIVHSMNAVAVYLISRGLPLSEGELSLGLHFIVVPIAMVANCVPLPGGLGAMEFSLDFLYRAFSPSNVATGHGFVVALAFRVITMVIAMVGVFYYLSARREVSELIHEAEHVVDDGAPIPEGKPLAPTSELAKSTQ
jgi:uncharacterized protein (TIRG00374 family)